MSSQRTSLAQHTLPIQNRQGSKVIILQQKAPLKNPQGEVIGVLATAIDVTEPTYAERAAQTAITKKLEEQETFCLAIRKYAHDLSSPITSFLLMLDGLEDFPEDQRSVLRHMATHIQDTAQHLVHAYNPESGIFKPVLTEEASPVLVCSTIRQVITEKRHEYKDKVIEFHEDFGNHHMAFVRVEPLGFRGMISNLLNYAIEGQHAEGIPLVRISVEISKGQVTITLKDATHGMDEETLFKIRNRQPLTGRGLGFIELYDLAHKNHGSFTVESQKGVGTTISLTLPQVPSPLWMAERIVLKPQDLVVVVDDDISIHSAWEQRLQPWISQITIKHFAKGRDAIDFFKAQSPEQKEQIVLLADYDLPGPDHLAGSYIIKTAKVPRSFLVSGYHSERSVLKAADFADVKILPKVLMGVVPIEMGL
jgi:signal transduction histidine kinase